MTARFRTAAPGTAAGRRGGPVLPEEVGVGEHTRLIYGLIRDRQLDEAVRVLNQQLANFPRSRAALALLAHCYYELQDFQAAAQVRHIF